MTSVHLVEATEADFDHLISGNPPPGYRLAAGGIEAPAVIEMLRDLANTLRPDFAPAAWMMVCDGEIVGLCSMVKPFENGVLHIGYGVAASRQQKGMATAAIADLLSWAANDGRISCISADTSTANIPSQKVLRTNGFELTGERDDPEDGPLLCWRADLLHQSR